MADNAKFDLERDGLRMVRRVLLRVCNLHYGGAFPHWMDMGELEGSALQALALKLRGGALEIPLAEKVAHDAMIDAARKEHRQNPAQRRHLGVDSDGEPETLEAIEVSRLDLLSYSGDGRLTRVWEASKKLPERQRRAVELHYCHGYTASEIARILRKTPKGAKRLIQNARDSLREILLGGAESSTARGIVVRGSRAENLSGGVGPSRGSRTVRRTERERRSRAA
jgi:RNA polymerase sigma factor (sigma-70 family)